MLGTSFQGLGLCYVLKAINYRVRVWISVIVLELVLDVSDTVRVKGGFRVSVSVRGGVKVSVSVRGGVSVRVSVRV